MKTSTKTEEIYLENSRFCKQYADRLLEQGKSELALEVAENGLETVGSKSSLQWLAAELYRDRDAQKYRETLIVIIVTVSRSHRLEEGFSEVVASLNLSWFRRYRDPVGEVHPEEMEQLVSQERFEGFVEFLKQKHSNRPAFLNELEKAGF